MKKTLLFLLFALSIIKASANIYNVSASLNGDNVVPVYATSATGTLTGTFNDLTGVLNFTATSSIPYNPEIPYYNFYTGQAGTNGTQIQSFLGSESYTYSDSFTLSNIQNLLAGNIYIEISSGPDKIRGQLSATTIQVFDSSTMNDFYGIGGYSYTEGNFPANSLGSPYVRSGPLPNNDFTFVTTSPNGLFGLQGRLTTFSSGQPITLTFKGNNVKKMRAFVRSEDINGVPQNGASITATATTNLGSTAPISLVYSVTNATIGFRVLNENEYITQVVFSAPSNNLLSTTIDNIMIGDDNPQNVALNFDGVDDFVSIPSNVGNFNFLEPFTVSCWVKPNPSQPGGSLDVEILEKWSQTGPYPFVIRLLTSGIDAGKVRVARYDNNNNPAMNSITAINDGKWHHIALTTTGGNGGIMNLYIDGVKQGSGVTDNTNASTTNSSPLFLGQRGNGVNRFKGEIDEVRIWTVAKTATEIANERFCKNPNTTNLQAAYNFNNGVPNGNNFLISQIQDAVGTNHGALSGFTQTGDVSNWVTGQVKYVSYFNIPQPSGNDGKSWGNSFLHLQNALTANACNDLFDVYVSAGSDSPDKPNYIGDINQSFNIPAGMKIYGGFANTEKNINERNRALIHSTYKTILTGDLGFNDTPFNFASNRSDNSLSVVKINGDNIIFDGFTVRGGQSNGIFKVNFGDVKISNCRIVDNGTGLNLIQDNSIVSNCLVAGNSANGIYILENSNNFLNCLIANNGGNGIFQFTFNTNLQTNLINCTIAANGSYGISNSTNDVPNVINNTIKNTIIKDNGGGIVNSGIGTTNNTITYSLVHGVSTGTGNLNGNTINPQFVSPLANNVKSDAGNYRLKDSSPCINVGDDAGVTPLDLDRNVRPFGGKTDMGAYESNVNMNEIISIATGNWESNSTWNLDRTPIATDKVIMDGHTVTVTTNTAKAKIIEQKPSSDLKFNNGGSLQLNQ